MFVHLSSATSFFSPVADAIKEDRLKFVVSCLALGILFAGALYWIVSRLTRKVQQQASPELSPIFNRAHPYRESDFAKDKGFSPSSFPYEGSVEKQAKGFQQKQKKSEEISEKALQTGGQQVDEVFDSKKGEDYSEGDDNLEIFDQENSLVGDDDIDEYLSGILSQAEDEELLLQKKQIESDLSQLLKQEKQAFYYEGMFTRYEGVHLALKEYELKSKHEWVNFCNSSFVAHHQKTKDKESHWMLHISVNPAQRYLAWAIVGQLLSSTPLCIQGKIHSTSSSEKSKQCPPGTEISLNVLKVDETNQTEWLQFLSLIAHQFSEMNIQPDSRPIKRDPQRDGNHLVISCNGVPNYFTYRPKNLLDDPLKFPSPFTNLKIEAFK